MRVTISTKFYFAAATFTLVFMGTLAIALRQLAKLDELAVRVCSQAHASGGAFGDAGSTRVLEACGELTTAVAHAESKVRMAGIGGLMVALGLAMLAALGARWRLRRLVHVVADVSAGNLEARADARGRDEVALLARGFNKLAEARNAAEGELNVRVHRRTVELQLANAKLQNEVSERERAEHQLRHRALHDALTGLANRALLNQRLEQCLRWKRRRADHGYAVLFIDLDNFKLVNDSLGHDAGDDLLIQTARRLMTLFRGTDCVSWARNNLTARLGGDEFIVLLEGLRSPEDAEHVASRIQKELLQPFHVLGHEIAVSCSIGIAMDQPSYERIDDVLRDADTAMYRAKVAGKGQYAIFNEAMHERVRKRLEVENDLRRAIEENQIRVMYQPIVDLGTRQIVAFEALARWPHPEKGLISPADFIPVAEETGLIVPLGIWVLRESLSLMRSLDRTRPDANGMGMNVNVSRRQLQEPSFVSKIRELLKEFELEPKRLRLEITESVVVMASEPLMTALSELRELGVELHLDDFGTGLSSLSCLKDFPLNVLKIDRTFVQGVRLGTKYSAILGAIVSLAHNLNLGVTAEGIEEEDQLHAVRALGCDFGQGYLFDRAMPAADVRSLLQKGTIMPATKKAAPATALA